ncbi:MAG: hypothetical protein R2854_03215 [Caldilineaceae bacterium]
MAQDKLVPEGAGAGSVPVEERNGGWLDRPLSDLIRVDWETIAWAVLMVVAAVTRFYNLGARAMSHDESLHTLYSYYLYNAGTTSTIP